MKKQILGLFLLSLLLLSACGLKNVDEHSSQSLNDTEVLNIVLKDIDRHEEDIVIKRIKKDFENGNNVYDIELYDESFEYDYEIDEAGKILKSEKEALKTTHNPKETSQDGITEKEALKIVLEHANLNENDISLVKIEKDYDDGQYTYELDFYTKDHEYEYEVTLEGGIIKSEHEKRK